MISFYTHFVAVGIAVTLFAAACGAGADATGDGGQLVRNGDFSAAGKDELPSGWFAWVPAWKHAAGRIRKSDRGLLVDGAGNSYAVGGVVQKISGAVGGRAYAIDVLCELRGLRSPRRSAMVRVRWTRGGRRLHPAGMLVRGPLGSDKGKPNQFRDVLVAPSGADGAVISLELKWPGGGSVLWRRVSVRPTEMPKGRKVRLGTIYLRPRSSTPEKNMKLWCDQIDAAGKLKLDAVCLGEAILQVGTNKSTGDVAKPIPGADTKALGAAAKRNNIWVIAGLAERDGDVLYNTAVLLDRQGKIAGKYRKIHLPREEWTKGVTPGGDYPVFKTDFGAVAIQICYDWFFPEAAEIFALKGAEVLFAPTWGNTLPDRDGCVDGENTFRVRARDNGLYLVPCVYDGSSMVIGPRGRILAASKGKSGVFWAEVDLGARERLPWVGHWRSIGPRDRMPATYKPLTAERREKPAAASKLGD
ncbi:MAG: carbon-nitrogen hydrolase family protein [Planctomycetes bacterium]|nr:carbon-nitrogen hydrolase family protein [Planctomycetota bacterium]